jgi:membrane fusion protein (multidrug efflux system)
MKGAFCGVAEGTGCEQPMPRMTQELPLPAVCLLVVSILGLLGCQPQQDDGQVATEVAVQVGKVIKADLRSRIEAYGLVEPEPAKAGKPGGGAKLAAPAAGVVLAVPVAEGQNVKSGDIVVRLDDRMALAAVEKARTAVVFADQLVERQRKLKVFDGTSDKALEDAQQRLAAARAEFASAQAALAQVQLASPLDGVVSRINVQPGQAVDPNTVAAEIIDLDRLVVTVSVSAEEAARLRAGQSADIITESADMPAATASVWFVSPSVDPKTGAAFARLALPKDSRLRPGQFARARIVTEELVGRLAVPRESVVKADNGQVVYLVNGDMAVQTPVKTGVRDGDLIEIEAGRLNEGDTVVTVGAYGLPKQTKIKIAGQ